MTIMTTPTVTRTRPNSGTRMITMTHDHADDHDHAHHDHAHHDHAHHDHAHHDHAHHADYNFRAAYIHVLADAVTSLLAITALGAAAYFGLPWLDPVAGLLGTVVIAVWAYGLIKSAAAVLLDAVPSRSPRRPDPAAARNRKRSRHRSPCVAARARPPRRGRGDRIRASARARPLQGTAGRDRRAVPRQHRGQPLHGRLRRSRAQWCRDGGAAPTLRRPFRRRRYRSLTMPTLGSPHSPEGNRPDERDHFGFAQGRSGQEHPDRASRRPSLTSWGAAAWSSMPTPRGR